MYVTGVPLEALLTASQASSSLYLEAIHDIQVPESPYRVINGQVLVPIKTTPRDWVERLSQFPSFSPFTVREGLRFAEEQPDRTLLRWLQKHNTGLLLLGSQYNPEAREPGYKLALIPCLLVNGDRLVLDFVIDPQKTGRWTIAVCSKRIPKVGL